MSRAGGHARASLLANRKIPAESPALYDLTATILGVFGIDKPKDMIGRNVLE